MAVMYDAGIGAAERGAIPQDAEIVAGHGFSPDLWARWPRAVHVTLAHSPAEATADVADFEPPKGSFRWIWGIPELRRWIRGHQQATGHPGTVYVNKRRIWMVNAAAAGLAPPFLWVSDWTRQPHLYPGRRVIATQWAPNWPVPGVDISEVSNVVALTGGRSAGTGALDGGTIAAPGGWIAGSADGVGGSGTAGGRPVLLALVIAAAVVLLAVVSSKTPVGGRQGRAR